MQSHNPPSTPSTTPANRGQSGSNTDSQDNSRNNRGRRSGSSAPTRSTQNPPASGGSEQLPTALSVAATDYLDEILAADMAAAPSGQPGQYHTCRVCLANNHPTQKCKFLNPDMTPEFMKVRESNYLRISKARRNSGSRQTPRDGGSSSQQDHPATSPANHAARQANQSEN